MTRENKAGLIPYFYNKQTKKYEYLMMISSDARYGGPDPMISKGGQDLPEVDGVQESTLETALREAEEELGLKRENLAAQPEFLVMKPYKWYDLYVYTAPVKSKEDFGKFCYETAQTVWMTAADFFKSGRIDHKTFVNALERRLNKK